MISIFDFLVDNMIWIILFVMSDLSEPFSKYTLLERGSLKKGLKEERGLSAVCYKLATLSYLTLRELGLLGILLGDVVCLLLRLSLL